jgi:ATP-binding cassette subfamily F protein uup
MPPPLLLLQDISLTFGVTPLLSGAALAIAAGDRICLVGRNGSGKSTLLRIAAGLVQADTGERFAQPGATIQYLPQEPNLAGFATTLAYVEAGFDATADGRHRALYLLKELGLSGDEDPMSLSGGEARRAALARGLAPSTRHPAARRANQSPGPARHRMAGAGTGRIAGRHRSD